MSSDTDRGSSHKNLKLAAGFLGVFALGAASTYGLMRLDHHMESSPKTVARDQARAQSLLNHQDRNSDHDMARAGIKKPERRPIDPSDLQAQRAQMDQMWDNFDQQFAQIQKEMNQRFQGFFGDVKDSFYDQAMQVSEAREGNQIIVKIDLKDVDENSVEVNIDDQMIHIKGERSVSEENQGQFGKSMTRSISSFSRAFSLPEGANPEGAKIEKGSGEITIVFDRSTV